MVAALLIGSGTASGALTGALLGGLVSLAVPRIGLVAAIAVIAGGVVLDVGTRYGRAPAALSRPRQVPQVWGRIFPLPTVAVLYGACLGVGPLTVLVTWVWWAATLAAATHGPLAGAVIGACFGGARLGLVVAWPERRPALIA